MRKAGSAPGWLAALVLIATIGVASPARADPDWGPVFAAGLGALCLGAIVIVVVTAALVTGMRTRPGRRVVAQVALALAILTSLLWVRVWSETSEAQRLSTVMAGDAINQLCDTGAPAIDWRGQDVSVNLSAARAAGWSITDDLVERASTDASGEPVETATIDGKAFRRSHAGVYFVPYAGGVVFSLAAFPSDPDTPPACIAQREISEIVLGVGHDALIWREGSVLHFADAHLDDALTTAIDADYELGDLLVEGPDRAFYLVRPRAGGQREVVRTGPGIVEHAEPADSYLVIALRGGWIGTEEGATRRYVLRDGTSLAPIAVSTDEAYTNRFDATERTCFSIAGWTGSICAAALLALAVRFGLLFRKRTPDERTAAADATVLIRLLLAATWWIANLIALPAVWG